MEIIEGMLRKIPKKIPLAFLPTPLEKAEKLTACLGGPNIFIKRDDCTGLAFGGNKVRKLEFIMGDALEKKADVIITTGGLQSNWARQTAAAAKKLGMEAILFLQGEKPQEFQGNLLLDKILGCDIRFGIIDPLGEEGEIKGEFPWTGKIADEVKEKGKIPYLAAIGGSNPLGNMGYITALSEMKDQLDGMKTRVDYITLATGTGGTQAGVELGVKLLGLETKVIGISISEHRMKKPDEICDLCNETLDFFELKKYRFTPDEIKVDMNYIGEGYAIPTKECIEAIRLVAQEEGILLDPVYTGKAMAGLIDLIEKGRFKKDDNVVFVHTGGNTAIFGYSSIF